MTALDNRVPYVKNTFLCLDPPKETPTRRAMSVSPKGSCDPFQRQLHALLYRPTPVRAQPHRCTPPEESEVVVGAPAERRARWCEENEENEESIKVTLPWVGASTTPRKDAKKKPADATSPIDRGEETPSTNVGSDSDAGPQSEDYYASLTDEELLPLVPRSEAGVALSIGSTGHKEGTCKPCVFAYNEIKPCQGGIRCVFCHYPHAPKVRVRLCKKKRMELRKQQEQDGYYGEEY